MTAVNGTIGGHMRSILQASTANIDRVWSNVSGAVEQSATLQDAAQHLLDGVYAEFGDSLALGRVFVTVPYADLPDSNRTWVAELANDKGVAGELKDTTPVLSLVGTRGEQDAWNDIRKSEGHVGIPLVSPRFVDAIPMVSRLLSDLGISDVASSPEGLNIERGASSVETFYVADASSTIDDQNRNIIPMQDFVDAHTVRTVFGAGGSYGYGTNSILVCIFFTKEEIPKDIAQQFEAIAEKFRDATKDLRTTNTIFSA